MDISQLSSTNSQANITSGTKTTMGKDDFLKLLISQLKNQDPMDPADGTQFAAQLAQFSSLEQLSNLNTNVSQTLDANYLLAQSVNNTMAATLIGKEAKLAGNSVKYAGQEEVKLGFNLPVTSTDVKVKVFNKMGTLVKEFSVDGNSPGDKNVVWDFTDKDGNKVAIGDYTFEVEAKGSDGNNLTIEKFKLGLIDGVKYTEQGTKLLVGKTEYLLSDILEILQSSNPGG